MLKVLTREIAVSVVVVVLATAAVFAILQATPGDPLGLAIGTGLAGGGLSEADIGELQATYGLDRGPAEQFIRWWSQVFRGNFGRSPHYPGDHALRIIVLKGLERTALLIALACLLLLVAAGPLGYALGSPSPPAWARAWSSAGALISSVPSFLLCLAVFYFFLASGHEPIRSTASLRDYTLGLRVLIVLLPAIILASAEGIFREMVETVRREVRTLRERDYILAAICRGQPGLPYILRGLALPVLGVLEGRTTHLLSTAVVVEQIFDINGLGYVSWEAIRHKDYFLILALTLVIAVTVRVIRIAANSLSALIDPRLRRRAQR